MGKYYYTRTDGLPITKAEIKSLEAFQKNEEKLRKMKKEWKKEWEDEWTHLYDWERLIIWERKMKEDNDTPLPGQLKLQISGTIILV